MIGILAVAVGVAVAGLFTLLLVQGVLRTRPADLPGPVRGLLRSLLPDVEWSGHRRISLAALPGVVILGCIVVVGLSVPIQFLFNPDWRSSKNNPGALVALLGLCAYGIWLAYVAASYRRASRLRGGRER